MFFFTVTPFSNIFTYCNVNIFRQLRTICTTNGTRNHSLKSPVLSKSNFKISIFCRKVLKCKFNSNFSRLDDKVRLLLNSKFYFTSRKFFSRHFFILWEFFVSNICDIFFFGKLYCKS